MGNIGETQSGKHVPAAALRQLREHPKSHYSAYPWRFANHRDATSPLPLTLRRALQKCIFVCQQRHHTVSLRGSVLVSGGKLLLVVSKSVQAAAPVSVRRLQPRTDCEEGARRSVSLSSRLHTNDQSPFTRHVKVHRQRRPFRPALLSLSLSAAFPKHLLSL